MGSSSELGASKAVESAWFNHQHLAVRTPRPEKPNYLIKVTQAGPRT